MSTFTCMIYYEKKIKQRLKKPMTYDIGNPGPDVVKPVNGIPTLLSCKLVLVINKAKILLT
jgi:hypothetical protein